MKKMTSASVIRSLLTNVRIHSAQLCFRSIADFVFELLIWTLDRRHRTNTSKLKTKIKKKTKITNNTDFTAKIEHFLFLVSSAVLPIANFNLTCFCVALFLYLL